jgi:hypothetical protein
LTVAGEKIRSPFGPTVTVKVVAEAEIGDAKIDTIRDNEKSSAVIFAFPPAHS